MSNREFFCTLSFDASFFVSVFVFIHDLFVLNNALVSGANFQRDSNPETETHLNVTIVFLQPFCFANEV